MLYFFSPNQDGKFRFDLNTRNPFETLKQQTVEDWTNRQKLSSYLPYDRYDPETQFYHNSDGTSGFVFECTPISGADEEIHRNLSALIDLIPDSGVCAITVYSSSYLEPILDRYGQMKIKRHANKLVDKSVEESVKFFRSGADGLPNLYGSPIRNNRLFFSFKIPAKAAKDVNLGELKVITKEALKGLYLTPRILEPEPLMALLFEIFNGHHNTNVKWNPMTPIADGLILAETGIHKYRDRLEIGDFTWRCVTPRTVAPFVDLQQTSLLFGSNRGAVDDSNQINTQFLSTLLIIKEASLTMDIREKAAFYQKQDYQKSILARTIEEYRLEYIDAVDNIEKGKSYYYTIPITWVFNRDPARVLQSSQRAQRLMKMNGYIPQEERHILLPLLLSSLPLSFELTKNNILNLERYFICKSDHASAMVPMVHDHPGYGNPHLLFVSRRGQVIRFDPWDKAASNKNWLVTGSSGAGKSFSLNDIVFSTYTAGAIVRIFDLGYSYLKQCKMLGGQFVDVSFENKICLNPYTFIPTGDSPDETEERYSQLGTVCDMIGAMVYSKTARVPDETEATLIKFAVNYVWEQLGPEGGVDQIYNYLVKFPDLAGQETAELCKKDDSCLVDLKKVAHEMAVKLTSWTKYGNLSSRMDWWFNGRANVNLRDADYICIEMEKIRREREIFNVVSIALINALTSTLYTLPRHIPKFIVFEECGIVLKNEGAIFKTVIEEAYRRSRKQSGSTITVFQSPEDIEPLGELGKTIIANSEFHLHLKSPNFRTAIEKGILPYPKEWIPLLETVSSQPPRYSEVALKTPHGLNIGRLVVDDYRYFIDTSDSQDWHRVQTATERHGGNLVSALDQLQKERAAEMQRYYGSSAD